MPYLSILCRQDKKPEFQVKTEQHPTKGAVLFCCPFTAKHIIVLKQININIITELAKATKVSEITIRRDLMELENLGYIKRVYGGAVSINGRTTVIPLVLRKQRNQEAKKAIARYAVTLISDGECIAMDSGSTILEMTESMQNLTDACPPPKLLEAFRKAGSSIHIVSPQTGEVQIIQGGEAKDI